MVQVSNAQWWFAVRICYEAVHPDPSRPEPRADRLYEARIILVRAGSEPEASERGEVIGRAGEQTYVSAAGDDVQWQFREILDVKQLFCERFTEGEEIYWELLDDVQLQAVRASLTHRPLG
jgi:hypothetical protein